MKSGRGGKRPGAGRKPINQDEVMIRVSGRLAKDQWEALKKAGGFSAIRRIINFCFLADNDLRQFIYFDDGRENSTIKTPNNQTKKAIEDTQKGKNLNHAKNVEDLFLQMEEEP